MKQLKLEDTSYSLEEILTMKKSCTVYATLEYNLLEDGSADDLIWWMDNDSFYKCILFYETDIKNRKEQIEQLQKELATAENHLSFVNSFKDVK